MRIPPLICVRTLRVLVPICLIPLPAVPWSGNSGEPPQAEEVVVTGSRMGRSLRDLDRQVTVISGEKLKDMPEASIPGILRLAAGADVRERGEAGVQADIALRGANYQQVLVLVDGVRMNDTQTAHHNMDLPVPLGEIERVEILHGHGSSAWGADAFGGVVNVITRKPGSRRVSAAAFAGQYGTKAAAVSLSDSFGAVGSRLSVERRSSDGFAFDRDYRVLTVLSKSSAGDPNGETGVTAGFVDKDFGAFDFYTPHAGLPSREETRTVLASIERVQKAGKGEVKVRASGRRHYDRFVLDFTRPDFYSSDHVTDQYGGAVEAIFPLTSGLRASAGAEIGEDRIESGKLGDHRRGRGALFAEILSFLSDQLSLGAGLRADDSAWGRKISPSGGASWRPYMNLKIRASLGRSFREPTFTELYYRDPLNTGNPELKPETADCYELGADLAQSPERSFFATVYGRDQKGVIDWIGASPAGPWSAANTGRVAAVGVEAGVKASLGSVETTATAAWVRARRDAGAELKYGLSYAARTFSTDLLFPSPLKTRSGLSIQYARRADGNESILAGARVGKRAGRFRFHVSVFNALDREYEEIPGVPGPGRTVGFGISWDWAYESGLTPVER